MMSIAWAFSKLMSTGCRSLPGYVDEIRTGRSMASISRSSQAVFCPLEGFIQDDIQ
jgi:hypothetical protein